MICRCGTECVVKILDNQWFLKYSDEEWTQKTLNCLENMNTVPEEIRSNFEYYLNWLHDWACKANRLGNPLPWDPQWLIELSVIQPSYMSYYTIAPYLKDIDPEEMDEEFLDHIFLDKKTNKTNIPPGMKEEFNYWYPSIGDYLPRILLETTYHSIYSIIRQFTLSKNGLKVW